MVHNLSLKVLNELNVEDYTTKEDQIDYAISARAKYLTNLKNEEIIYLNTLEQLLNYYNNNNIELANSVREIITRHLKLYKILSRYSNKSANAPSQTIDEVYCFKEISEWFLNSFNNVYLDYCKLFQYETQEDKTLRLTKLPFIRYKQLNKNLDRYYHLSLNFEISIPNFKFNDNMLKMMFIEIIKNFEKTLKFSTIQWSLMKNHLNTQKLYLDYTSVNFKFCRSLNDLERCNSNSVQFSLNSILRRDYFEFEFVHPLETTNNKKIIELILLGKGDSYSNYNLTFKKFNDISLNKMNDLQSKEEYLLSSNSEIIDGLLNKIIDESIDSREREESDKENFLINNHSREISKLSTFNIDQVEENFKSSISAFKFSEIDGLAICSVDTKLGRNLIFPKFAKGELFIKEINKAAKQIILVKPISNTSELISMKITCQDRDQFTYWIPFLKYLFVFYDINHQSTFQSHNSLKKQLHFNDSGLKLGTQGSSPSTPIMTKFNLNTNSSSTFSLGSGTNSRKHAREETQDASQVSNTVSPLVFSEVQKPCNRVIKNVTKSYSSPIVPELDVFLDSQMKQQHQQQQQQQQQLQQQLQQNPKQIHDSPKDHFHFAETSYDSNDSKSPDHESDWTSITESDETEGKELDPIVEVDEVVVPQKEAAKSVPPRIELPKLIPHNVPSPEPIVASPEMLSQSEFDDDKREDDKVTDSTSIAWCSSFNAQTFCAYTTPAYFVEKTPDKQTKDCTKIDQTLTPQLLPRMKLTEESKPAVEVKDGKKKTTIFRKLFGKSKSSKLKSKASVASLKEQKSQENTGKIPHNLDSVLNTDNGRTNITIATTKITSHENLKKFVKADKVDRRISRIEQTSANRISKKASIRRDLSKNKIGKSVIIPAVAGASTAVLTDTVSALSTHHTNKSAVKLPSTVSKAQKRLSIVAAPQLLDLMSPEASKSSIKIPNNYSVTSLNSPIPRKSESSPTIQSDKFEFVLPTRSTSALVNSHSPIKPFSSKEAVKAGSSSSNLTFGGAPAPAPASAPVTSLGSSAKKSTSNGSGFSNNSNTSSYMTGLTHQKSGENSRIPTPEKQMEPVLEHVAPIPSMQNSPRFGVLNESNLKSNITFDYENVTVVEKMSESSISVNEKEQESYRFSEFGKEYEPRFYSPEKKKLSATSPSFILSNFKKKGFTFKAMKTPHFSDAETESNDDFEMVTKENFKKNFNNTEIISISPLIVSQSPVINQVSTFSQDDKKTSSGECNASNPLGISLLPPVPTAPKVVVQNPDKNIKSLLIDVKKTQRPFSEFEAPLSAQSGNSFYTTATTTPATMVHSMTITPETNNSSDEEDEEDIFDHRGANQDTENSISMNSLNKSFQKMEISNIVTRKVRIHVKSSLSGKWNPISICELNLFRERKDYFKVIVSEYKSEKILIDSVINTSLCSRIGNSGILLVVPTKDGLANGNRPNYLIESKNQSEATSLFELLRT